MTPCFELEVQNDTHALNSVNGPGNIMEIKPKWERIFSVLWQFFIGYLLVLLKFKYQRWYLKSCCGLEVQNPTQALKSVKDPGNAFDLNPKWERTLLSFGNFSCDIYRPLPPKKSKYQSWYLTPCRGLEVQNPTQALNSVNGPGNIIEINPKWERIWLSFLNFSFDICSPLHKCKYLGWYVTPCYGIEVQNSTQALSSVKGPGNIL